MARAFSMATVIRSVPSPLMRQFLERLGIKKLKVDWNKVGRRNPTPLIEAFEHLSASAFDRLEVGFHAVFDLGCSTGTIALQEAANSLGLEVFPPEMSPDAGPYERAVHAYLHSPEVFHRASSLHQVEHLGWWRRRDDLPLRSADKSPEARRRLADALSKLFVTSQGRGRVCTVEVQSRRGVD